MARRKEKLEALCAKLSMSAGKFYPFQCDITVEEELLSAFKWTTENVGPVYFLVNNAGVYRDTNLIDGNSDEWMKVLMTNVFALSVATREAVKIMRKGEIKGHVVNVNCLSGHRNLYYPNMNLYGASKHAVTALTETFRQELILNKSNIKVTVIFKHLLTICLDFLRELTIIIKLQFCRYLLKGKFDLVISER